MFIAAQFIIAKCWKQPKCPPVNEWVKKLVHLHNGILHSREKEGTSALCDSMDGTGEHMLSEISQVVKDEYLWSHLDVEPNEQNKQASKIEPETWK